MKEAPAKIVTLAFYVAALVSLFVTWPPLLEKILQIGTLLLFAVHAIEVVLSFKWIKLYEGPLAVSILLFGFMHWMPYKRRAEQGGAR